MLVEHRQRFRERLRPGVREGPHAGSAHRQRDRDESACVGAVPARMSTTPVVPLTLTRSPLLIVRVATEVPITAGIANSRDSTAACEVSPPASVTRPAILVKSATHAGLVIWHTTMSPLRTWSNPSVVSTTRATPSPTPGDPPRPTTCDLTVVALRWNFAGNPQFAR